MYLVDEGVVAVGNSVSLQCGSSGSHIRPHSAGFGHFEVRFRLPVTVLAAVPELRQHGSDGAELLSETVTESSHDGDDERAGQPDGPVKPVFSILKGGQKFLLANFFKTLCFVIRVINSTRENFNKFIIFSFRNQAPVCTRRSRRRSCCWSPRPRRSWPWQTFFRPFADRPRRPARTRWGRPTSRWAARPGPWWALARSCDHPWGWPGIRHPCAWTPSTVARDNEEKG